MQKTKLALTVLICFFISGCSADSIGGELKSLDQKIGDFFQKFQEGEIDEVLQSFGEGGVNVSTSTSSSEKKEEVDIKNLTDEQKSRVDGWLKERDLNRYGDPAGTFYTGGTPLFDEMTGLSVERYYYILKNNPEIVKFLENQN